MTRLSPQQLKAIEERRKPIRHAMDRLKERHMPEVDDDYAEMVVNMMRDLCELRCRYQMGQTATIVNEEKPDSVIIDLDMYENLEIIRVCYDPIANRIRTVFP